MTCPFSKEVWKYVGYMTMLRNPWDGGSTKEAFKTNFINKDRNNIKSLPLNVAWGIWLAKKLNLFER